MRTSTECTKGCTQILLELLDSPELEEELNKEEDVESSGKKDCCLDGRDLA